MDAGIVWNAVAFERRDALDAVPIARELLPQPGVDAVTSATYGHLDMSSIRVEIVTLKGSKRLEEARKLAEFTASAKGRAVFAAKGFSPAPEGGAAREPSLSGSLLVHCAAAGLKDPVSEIARLFETDTGVKVELTFASSGQLLAQISTTRKGDVYVPGRRRVRRHGPGEGPDGREASGLLLARPGRDRRRGEPPGDPASRGPRPSGASPRPRRRGVRDRQAPGGDTPEGRRGRRGAAQEHRRLAGDRERGGPGREARDGGCRPGRDSTAAMYPAEADVVAIPLGQNVVGTAAACALSGSSNPGAASEFVEYLASEKARAVFRARHFTVDEPGLEIDDDS